MSVVNRRDKADDQTILDGHRQMVARVRQKLVGPPDVDRVVEDVRRNVRENARVLGAQELDFDRHRSSSALRRRTGAAPGSASLLPSSRQVVHLTKAIIQAKEKLAELPQALFRLV
jgi:hypothetical protein